MPSNIGFGSWMGIGASLPCGARARRASPRAPRARRRLERSGRHRRDSVLAFGSFGNLSPLAPGRREPLIHVCPYHTRPGAVAPRWTSSAVSRRQASSPGHRRHSSSILSVGRIMNAVDRASATAAGEARRPAPRGTRATRHPDRAFRHGTARARVDDVVALPRPGGAQGLLARRDAGRRAAAGRGAWRAQCRAASPRPLGGRLERHDRAPAAVDERALDPPLLQQLRHAVDRVTPCRCRRGRGATPSARAWTVQSSGTSSSRSRPEPTETSKAPPVSSNMCRAISRHSIVDGLTRVAPPCGRAALMRETSLLGTKRLSSCSRRSRSAKAAWAAWRGVARRRRGRSGPRRRSPWPRARSGGRRSSRRARAPRRRSPARFIAPRRAGTRPTALADA